LEFSFLWEFISTMLLVHTALVSSGIGGLRQFRHEGKELGRLPKE
jgi:hypothetical protein